MSDRPSPDDRVDRFLAELGAVREPADLAGEVAARIRADGRPSARVFSRSPVFASLAVGAIAIALIVALLPVIVPVQEAKPTDLGHSAPPMGSPTAVSGPTVGPTLPATPAATAARKTPPPAAIETITITVRETRAPISGRINASSVWTGSEVLFWGGWEWGSNSVFAPPSSGAAYDPLSDRWRRIADAPIGGSAKHLATWTGKEMLVWGGYRRNGPQPPRGAAYDPATDTWRSIAPAPVRWGEAPGEVWTGTEWIIGVPTREHTLDVVAYDPGTDAWRSLPLPQGTFDIGSSQYLAWTGAELILYTSTDGSMYRLPRDSESWIAATTPSDFWVSGPMVWTGRGMIAPVFQHPSTLLAEWDVTSDSWRLLPGPPSSVGGDIPVWVDQRVIHLAGSALVFDPASESWSNLEIPPTGPAGPFDRRDAVLVWAGDRLIVWGGWAGGLTDPEPYQVGYVLTPEW